MKAVLDIPDSRVSFMMELLGNFTFDRQAKRMINKCLVEGRIGCLVR